MDGELPELKNFILPVRILSSPKIYLCIICISGAGGCLILWSIIYTYSLVARGVPRCTLQEPSADVLKEGEQEMTSSHTVASTKHVLSIVF